MKEDNNMQELNEQELDEATGGTTITHPDPPKL
jgi:hypothetical protein